MEKKKSSHFFVEIPKEKFLLEKQTKTKKKPILKRANSINEIKDKETKELKIIFFNKNHKEEYNSSEEETSKEKENTFEFKEENKNFLKPEKILIQKIPSNESNFFNLIENQIKKAEEKLPFEEKLIKKLFNFAQKGCM